MHRTPLSEASTSEPAAAAETVDMADTSSQDKLLHSEIDAQLNLEILLKHNELRLIEQELAKCQIALEQLRRCELIPYPGIEDASAEEANGVGPTLETPHSSMSPPGPWSLTDGPYARHNEQRETHFTPSVSQQTFANQSSTPYFTRARHNSGALLVSPISTAHDLSRPYGDPLIIKRQQDDKWVKLYCAKCKPERSDFNNVQGFLNHCRISHKDCYESHEAAAITCGRPVEVNNATMDTPHVRRHRSSLALETPGSKTSTVATPCVQVSSQGLVHKFNKPFFAKPDKAALRQSILLRRFDPARVSNASASTAPTEAMLFDSSFVPCSQTPNLSKFLQKRNFPGNLDATVALMKRKAGNEAESSVKRRRRAG